VDYNPLALMSGRAQLLVALAILVAAFVALHPYLDEAGLCGLGGCPDASQSSHAAHGGFSTACLVAVLVASPAAYAFASSLGRRRAYDQPGLTETYLSPDPPPPRVSPSH
jgi:hypothetical protein